MRRYNGPGDTTDHAYSIAVDAIGYLYVTGKSYGAGTDYDIATIKCLISKHGEVNLDGNIDVVDMVYLVNYLFRGGPDPKPIKAGDVNCDGDDTIADAVYLINYLFKSGPPPCD